MFDGSKDPDFVESIFLFPVREVQHLHFFEGVLLVVLHSAHSVDLTIRTVSYEMSEWARLTKLGEDLEFTERH